MAARRRASDTDIINAIASTTNMSLAAEKAGLHMTSFVRRAKLLGVYVPNQMDPTNRTTPDPASHRYELSDILTGKHPQYSTNDLRKRLLREQVFAPICSICGCTDANFCLDHINGDSKDHKLENLRLLCLNCHSKTDTFAGKNKRKFTQPTHDVVFVDLLLRGMDNNSILKNTGMVANGANYKRLDKIREIVNRVVVVLNNKN